MTRLEGKRKKVLQLLVELNELEYKNYLNFYKRIEDNNGIIRGYWDEDFVDEDTGEVISIERSEIVCKKFTEPQLKGLVKNLEYE
ncbi:MULTISPECIES: hypothetical protein [unclassified Empedobacter]|uniref:hypothetical protein n=1 Tax=unclassified Empedobacter TaxID=2643773 RepID=UPI0025776482|nr:MULTISPECIES: hypothetical protein [unclassified Empedobacter]MDM1138879.1 hypothetical protein [Empedobacter sp. R132-2]